MFSATSRYYGIETTTMESIDGREVACLRRRFQPPATTTIMAEHQVTEGERLDNITARYLGDPEQFWRLCDAEYAMHPRELADVIGRRLRIPLIQGGG